MFKFKIGDIIENIHTGNIREVIGYDENMYQVRIKTTELTLGVMYVETQYKLSKISIFNNGIRDIINE